MIPIPTSLIAWNQEKQCPGIIQCKTVTQFQGIPLTPFPVLPGIIPVFQFPVLLLPLILCIRILAQCPGLIKRITVQTRCPPLLRALLFPLRSRKRRAERRALERESRNNSFIQKRAGPISAQQFQQFQQERPSRSLRPATPHQPCGRQCTYLPGL